MFCRRELPLFQVTRTSLASPAMEAFTQHTASPALSHVSLLPPQPSPAAKRPYDPSFLENQVPKRIKISNEEPALYSENVRRKLASTTRTGQACDRCKERKMKCDPDPVACQPCRQKNLKCYTTDRVSGQSRERGQSDRADYELQSLRDQLAAYQRKYGPLQDVPLTPGSGVVASPDQRSFVQVKRSESDLAQRSYDLPSDQYVGWPELSERDQIYKGPVQGTQVDTIDWGIIDSGAFECELTREPMSDDTDLFNFSVSSVLKTIYQRQRINWEDLQLPSRDEALKQAEMFLDVMWAYYPVVHRQSFFAQVNRLYDTPQSVSAFEKIQIVQMLSVLQHQRAIRNQADAARIKDCYRYLHYSLGYFPDILKSDKVSAMQAMCMILLQFRNMPKPGYTWPLAQQMLIKCIDQDYHRDPEKIELPHEQQNSLAKELRKRVFHAVIGVCIATGCRLGRPAPWQFVKWDVPLPTALLDSEISLHGIQEQRSGQCKFWCAIQLAKLLPLYTELHNHILAVRREPREYLQTVDALKAKIDAWRAECDILSANEEHTYHVEIQTLLVEHWAAEFILNLYHPKVSPVQAPEVLERNLDVCHRAAKRMLTAFHTLSLKYKGADFTWHSVVAYTLGFSLTLHVYRRKRNLAMTQKQYNDIRNELAGWMSLCGTADIVLLTDSLLHKRFGPLVDQVQEELRQSLQSQAAQQANGVTVVNSMMSRPSISHRQSIDVTASAVSLQQQTDSPMSAPMIQQQYNTIIKEEQYPQRMPPQHYGSPSSYHMPHGIPATSFPMYPSTTSYAPHLPTSLAPLLNEPASHNMAQYQQYQHFPISVQDPNMQFTPTLYTAADAQWPLAPDHSS